ncbi:hypothetical protein FB639_004271, partial [Coemansia asiatica]
MHPTKNRFQNKKTRPFNSRSVVLSSEPVIHKSSLGSEDKLAGKEQGTVPAVAAPSEWVVVEEEKRTKGPVLEIKKEKPKSRTRTNPGHILSTNEGTGLSHRSFVDAAASESSSEQYTYITDENGYTWLYDTVYGQYYYYNAAQGTYVPYGGDY